MKIPRIRLSKDEYLLIRELRSSGSAGALAEECKRAGIPLASVRSFWHKTKHISINCKPGDVLSMEAEFEPIIKDLKSYSPKFQKITRQKIKDPHCLVLDPADIHVGKLAVASEVGEDYNIEIATRRVHEATQGLLNKSSGFNLDQIILVLGNDCIHTDTPNGTTTGGTKQDTSGMWYEAFLAAKDMYVALIEMLLPLADIKVIFCPSNHDYLSGFMLAQVVQSYFRHSKNIKFDTSMSHRKYTLYGNSLLGFSHGDGAKMQDTPLLMASEAPRLWSKSIHRNLYLHHFHHRIGTMFMHSKDFIGVSCDHLRSPSVSDSWHHRNGYVSPSAIEAFIHSKNDGQIARFTHFTK